MDIYIKEPLHCTDDELIQFIDLVKEGGEVDQRGLKSRVQRAKKLFYIFDRSLIGVGAIKKPNNRYKSAVFKKAMCDSFANRYNFEIGWMYVVPTAQDQRVGRRLMEEILNELNGKSCYITTRTDNEIIKHMLNKYGFKQLGSEYSSESGDYSLVLYVNRISVL